MSNNKRLSCGRDCLPWCDLRETLTYIHDESFDFANIPLCHPRFRREFISGKSMTRKGPFTRPDMCLTSSDWNSMVVGKISPYITLDSINSKARKLSQETLVQELMYAAHLGLPAVTFRLTKPDNPNLARYIFSKIIPGCFYQIWIQVPLVSPAVTANSYRSNPEEMSPVTDTWHWWNNFRSLCNSEKKLGLVLEVSYENPPAEEINRWLGEPVKALVVPTDIFLTNKRGYPVLSKSHQSLVKAFFSLDVQVIVSGNSHHVAIKHYQQYLNYLYQSAIQHDPVTVFATGYEDYLQCPLQPLSDNLESQTYEVFEKDPIKYREYQRAVYQALLDRVSEENASTVVTVVMVLGAGRGPLVRASLNAAELANRLIKVYAVEKNPNAIVTLEAHCEESWKNQVTVISCDMRDWNPPEMADIIVSELLGSFGDNELSPECLDGAQRLLKEDGISIPSSYTSFLAPVQSSKLYNEVRLSKDIGKLPISQFETPYVVHQRNKYTISGSQALFTFHHPNKVEKPDNTRYGTLKFDITQDCVLHGFAGFFETVLYKDVLLSIVPETYSTGMISWFPIFFPILEPIQLKPSDELVVHFWRLLNKKNVWFEWTISKPVPLPIHNPNGRSYTIGLL
ncbi:unnamed protein product [Bemisia tabaci]|uniref:Protein arginine N-methyltransferase n=1 Tax=Bemisia tabaci TaxID=7038 RepID=A0A9P0F0H3_BEMTA|nr:unnamed protein product [Bemisia tabaci]